MTEPSDDTGVIMALLERFEKQRLPRARALKAKVDGGAPLDDADMDYLKQVFADTQQVQALLSRHPEYEKLVAQVMQLYTAILQQAAQNEQA
ncbi:MAG TPA: hypothetical protein VIX81_04095 [Gammaproteobacteria bacterium]